MSNSRRLGRRIYPYATLALSCALASCSGGGRSITPTASVPNQPAAPTVPGTVGAPPPLLQSDIYPGSPKLGKKLTLHSLPGLKPAPFARMAPSGDRRRVQNTSTTPDGHVSYGAFVEQTNSSGATPNGVQANLSVASTDVRTSGSFYLYETTRPPNPAPLEVGVFYYPNTAAYVGVYDWANTGQCGGNACVGVNLADPTSRSTYVWTATAPDGTTFPAVAVESIQDSGGTWHAYIYNPNEVSSCHRDRFGWRCLIGAWDQLATETVSEYPSGTGWVIDEFYNGYPNGGVGLPCPAIPGNPLWVTQAYAIFNGSAQLLDDTNSYVQIYRDAGCFDSPYQTNWWGEQLYTPNNAWKITSN